jgi:adenosylcobinamide-GDP ribazoletransferase
MRRALAFLTPLGRPTPPTPSALAWFPAVGAVLGLALGGLWWLAGEIWPAMVAAAVVVAADLALTGMLHLDGLIDSADGLLPAGPDGARRLEIMADPHAGAFGVGAALAVLGVRWASLGALRPSVLLLAGLWCASRTTMAAVLRSVPYARPGGLASAFRAPHLGGGRRGGNRCAPERARRRRTGDRGRGRRGCRRRGGRGAGPTPDRRVHR